MDGRSPLAPINYMSGVYQITCVPTGKFYIGSTKKLRARELSHRGRLRQGNHGNRHLQYAWNKHGEGAFIWTILLVCAVHDVLRYEQRALDILKPTLNILPLAGSALGRKLTPQGLKNITAGNRRKWADPAARAKVSATLSGRARPPEVINKIRASHVARAARGEKPSWRPPLSPEARAKISASLKGRPKSPETRAKLSAALKGRKPVRLNPGQLKLEI